MNVQMRVYLLRTFITCPLIHMHQKKKIALQITAKIASDQKSDSFHMTKYRMPMKLKLQNGFQSY